MADRETDVAKRAKRDDLIFEFVKQRYVDEVSRREKLDEQARSLVSSILVGIGFLLAAGTTDLVNVNVPTVIFYFIGVALLISTVIIDFIVLRIRTWKLVPNVETLLKEYTKAPYEFLQKRVAATMAQSLSDNVK